MVSEDSTSRVMVFPVRVLTTVVTVSRRYIHLWQPALTDLHATTQTEDEMEGGFLLDVVVGQSAAVLELLASKDQALLVGRNALFVLDLGLDIVDGVRRLHLQSDGLASEGLDDCNDVSIATPQVSHIDLQICIPPRRRSTKCKVDSF